MYRVFYNYFEKNLIFKTNFGTQGMSVLFDIANQTLPGKFFLELKIYSDNLRIFLRIAHFLRIFW